MDTSNEKIGAQIRVIRKAKKLTINEVAKQTGFTSSFISQFERGLTKASISSLQKITSVLNINLSTLFAQENNGVTSQTETPTIVRKEKRSKLIYPDEKSVDYLLTSKTEQFSMTMSIIEPGGSSGDLISHNGSEEAITVLKGEAEITLGTETHYLNNGDTITFPSHIPHAWKNNKDDTLHLIWVVSPPTY